MRSFAKNLQRKLQKYQDDHGHHGEDTRHHHHHHHHESGHGASERKVFAHYMVGLTHGQTYEEWLDEITQAQTAGIDGFALNIGPSDPFTVEQLRLAYAAAAQVSAGETRDTSLFVLFLSFDMAAGEWTVPQVVSLINEFKDSSAQCRVVDGGGGSKPLVSTFEGPGWAENWAAVREAVTDGEGIYLVPDWSSLGPHGVREKLDLIDGAFSWGAWPRAGQRRMGTEEDEAYKGVLGRGKGSGKKAYMMGVSPWFYTRLPQWNKNWHSSGESLWFDRWKQIWDLKPDFVQIITWNDFGESSYICDPKRPTQVVPGAEKYVIGHSHDAFRATLPYFIRLYKAAAAGEGAAVPEEDSAVAWYRTTLASCGHDGDTVWGQGGSQSAREGTRDIISVLAITAEATTVTLTIGHSSPQELKTHQHHHHYHRHVSFFEVPLDGRTGDVTISLNGRTTSGPPITNECPPFGHVVYNCTAIQV